MGHGRSRMKRDNYPRKAYDNNWVDFKINDTIDEYQVNARECYTTQAYLEKIESEIKTMYENKWRIII